MRWSPVLLASALVACGAAPLAAVDGVIEINQARALAGGITAGDTPGFPVDISLPGSYRLTGNLESLTVGLDIVHISSEGVTLDLNGFEIHGPNSCTGTPPGTDVTCTYESDFNGDGVDSAQHATIRNGRIRGATYRNVNCPLGCRVENVDVSEAKNGLLLSGHSVVTGCTATLHAETGISTNTGTGGSVVIGNISSQNGGEGFFLGQGDTVQQNLARDNHGTGIFSNGGTLIGNTARGNFGNGMRISTGTVVNNTSQNNTGFGLLIATSSKTGYGGNVFTDNTGGTVSGTGIQIGTNLCGTSSTCP